MKIKRIAKIIILVAIVCFFLPFISVSCSGMKETYTGMQLAFGGKVQDESMPLNVMLFFALLLGLASIIVSFVLAQKKKNSAQTSSRNLEIIPPILSGLAAFLVLLFRLTFNSYYKLGEFAAYLTITTDWGFFVVLILLIVGTVCFVLHEDLVSNIFASKFGGVGSQASQPFASPPGGAGTASGGAGTASGGAGTASGGVSPQASATAAFCASCGKKLNPGEMFCPSCGTPVKK